MTVTVSIRPVLQPFCLEPSYFTQVIEYFVKKLKYFTLGRLGNVVKRLAGVVANFVVVVYKALQYWRNQLIYILSYLLFNKAIRQAWRSEVNRSS